MQVKNEETKKDIKNYLRVKHSDKLSELILEGHIDVFLNKWVEKYLVEINNLENFQFTNFEYISEEELIAFNKDLSYQKIFDEIKNELN
jgi:hypothetical protein